MFFDGNENEDERKEIRRPLILFVHDVITSAPPDLADAFRQPERNLRLEMTKEQAAKLRDYLDEQLQKNIPGSIGVQFKGHLTI